jgi:putative Ig domain-containing protein/VCBS repeat protein
MRAAWRVSTLLGVLFFASSAVSYGQTLTAAWDPNPAADLITSYQVCIGTSSMSCNSQNPTVPPTTTSYAFTPAAGVLYYVGVRATSALGTGPYSAEVRISIPSLQQPSNRTSSINTAISPVTLVASDPDGSPLQFTHTGLPFGLTMNQATGVISGTPTSVGTYNVTVFVADGFATASRSFVWTITAPMPNVSMTPSLTSPQNPGRTVTFTATGSGGVGPLQYKFLLSANGAQPQTMRDWSTTRTYGWTPATLGDYTVTVWTRNNGVVADAPQGSTQLNYSVNMDGPWMSGGSHVTDVNGDHRTDLLLQGSNNTFYLATSSGTAFSMPTPVLWHGGAFNWDGAHVVDVNGDGAADVLFQGFDNSFWLSLWTGSGYSSPSRVLQHGGAFNPLGAHLADVNGDDRADVLMQGFDNSFWLSLSTGAGFMSPRLVLQHGGAFNPDGAHLADVDGDGQADVLMQGTDNKFWLSRSTGSGFTSPALVLQHGGAFNPLGAHLADVDGDGRADVLFQGFDNGFYLSLSTGSGFLLPTLVLKHGGPFNPYGAHIADVDGDGRADVLFQGTDNSFYLSRSTGSGFTSPTLVLRHGGPFNPYGARVADIDGDGRADVLFQGFDGKFWLSLSTGTGFTTPVRVW